MVYQIKPNTFGGRGSHMEWYHWIICAIFIMKVIHNHLQYFTHSAFNSEGRKPNENTRIYRYKSAFKNTSSYI